MLVEFFIGYLIGMLIVNSQETAKVKAQVESMEKQRTAQVEQLNNEDL